jgi:hypothetical protein
MEDLLAAFICRPITIQKFMNILLTQHKTLLTNLEKDSEGDTYDNQSRSIEAVMPAPLVDRMSNIASLTPLPKQKCYARFTQRHHLSPNVLCYWTQHVLRMLL